MKNLKTVGVALGAIVLLAAVSLWLKTPQGHGAGDSPSAKPSAAKAGTPGRDGKPDRKAAPSRHVRNEPVPAAQAADDADNPGSEPVPAMTEEEKKEAEEEKRVDEFDKAVDKWMEPRGKAVTMEEVDKFRDMFRRVPKARKDECVHRALNLIPDENVMLLAGILFDKEQDKDILDLVYNDILNRDEDVKKPILREIFKDRGHPNWADTAWILDVTGELPGAKK
ncbi:MAG: hypothetical protein IJ658_02460 [Kiritimatiellae bacterium]|nr:hypothetical protein [Kiritimatiellia bacterium]